MSGAGAAWTPLVLAVAPTGARRTRADHPELPITPPEIARTATACAEAGASMLHLHVRDGAGRHTLDVGIYRAAIAAVRREVGMRMVIQVTTEAAGRSGPAEQMALVQELRPEAASLALAELIPDAEAEAPAAEFLAWCRSSGIAVQYILYDAEDVRRFSALGRRGVISEERPFVLFVLGRYAAERASEPRDLLPFLAAHEGAKGPWALCAFGPRETACAVAAAALGGHARVGFENNLRLPDGALAPDNAALVAATAAGARVIGRPLADADTARELMAAT